MNIWFFSKPFSPAGRRVFVSLAFAILAPCLAHAQTAADAAVPRYAHVFVIVEENQYYEQILDARLAPRMSALARQYGVAMIHGAAATRAIAIAKETPRFRRSPPCARR